MSPMKYEGRDGLDMRSSLDRTETLWNWAMGLALKLREALTDLHFARGSQPR